MESGLGCFWGVLEGYGGSAGCGSIVVAQLTYKCMGMMRADVAWMHVKACCFALVCRAAVAPQERRKVAGAECGGVATVGGLTSLLLFGCMFQV